MGGAAIPGGGVPWRDRAAGRPRCSMSMLNTGGCESSRVPEGWLRDEERRRRRRRHDTGRLNNAVSRL